MEPTNVVYVLVMLIVTLLVFGVLMFMLKKLKSINPKFMQGIKIYGGANLGNKSKILMIDADGQKILIGVTELNINTLHVFKQDNIDQQPSFSEHLESRING